MKSTFEKLTHQVAVNSYLVKEEKFLMLKRKNPPLMWGPPGGRLNFNEDPIIGLKREVREETNLDVNVIMPVTTWFGDFNDTKILSIDYLCLYKSRKVKLSEEHEDYKWLSLEDLKENVTKLKPNQR